MFARKLFLVGLGILSPLLSACDDTECGDGTVEVDGVCVAADTDSSGGDEESGGTESPAFTAGGNASAVEDDDEGETEDGSSGEDEEPYQACPAESDVECAPNNGEFCIELTHTCSANCFGDDTLCPAPSGGTSVQRCEQIEVDPEQTGEACVLFCGGGLVCPEGMSCEATPVGISSSEDTLEICVWN